MQAAWLICKQHLHSYTNINYSITLLENRAEVGPFVVMTASNSKLPKWGVNRSALKKKKSQEPCILHRDVEIKKQNFQILKAVASKEK